MSTVDKARTIRQAFSKSQREFIMKVIAQMDKIEEMEALTVMQVLAHARDMDKVEKR